MLGVFAWAVAVVQVPPDRYWIWYDDGAIGAARGALSLKYSRTSSRVLALPKSTSYQSWALGEPPAPQKGSLIGYPSTAAAVVVPDAV